MAPEGVWMAMGSAVGHLLHTGVDGEKKWVVQPESAMAQNGGVGGPVVLAE